MVSDRGKRRSGKGKRWAIPLVLAVVALAAGAMAIPRIWVVQTGKAPDRLDLLYEAWNEFNAKRYDQASNMLDRRAAVAKPTALDWMLRARIAESQGRLVDALDNLKLISDSDSVSAQAWLKAGQIELARHRARAGETAFLRSLTINPDQLQPYRELAYLYAIQRRKRDADAQFRAIAQRMPMNHVLAFVWCQNFCDIWDPDESGKVLREFVAEDPDDRWSRLALATSYSMKSQFDEAEATVAPLAESDVDARAIRVKIAIEKGEIDTARDLAKSGPDDDERLNVLRGQLALNTGAARTAADSFKAVLQKDPESRHAIHGLGMALRRLKDPGSEKWVQIAARHDRLRRTIVDSVTTLYTDPKLLSKLGALCEALHRIEEARVWYRIAIERDPLDTDAQQGLTRLGSVGLLKQPSDIEQEFH